MKFCDECGSMMKSGAGEDHWVCDSCGYEIGREDGDDEWTTQSQVESEIVDVSDAEDKGLPTTTA
ncbi:transcription factor S, partial [Halorubrum sp. SD612]